MDTKERTPESQALQETSSSDPSKDEGARVGVVCVLRRLTHQEVLERAIDPACYRANTKFFLGVRLDDTNQVFVPESLTDQAELEVGTPVTQEQLEGLNGELVNRSTLEQFAG